MIALRSRRLETLLGASLDALTASHVRGLVEISAQEAYDLDFKRSLYGRGDQDKQALAGDVAALANTAGGMIILGVEEDDQARAAAAPGVEVTDGEMGRMRQIVASRVVPLPDFDILSVMEDEVGVGEAEPEVENPSGGRPTPRRGFLVIAVPRSPNAPHAVLVDDGLRYPKRNGATTRYLSEPEVAAAYRDRFAGAARQAERLDEVEGDALARLDRRTPWLVVTLVPDLPGDLVITTPLLQQFKRETESHDVGGIVRAGASFLRVSVGRRRLLADGSTDSSPTARYASLELHTDGAGASAIALADMSEARPQGPGAGSRHLVHDEAIAVAVVSGLARLAQHARDRAAAGGTAAVRATLILANDDAGVAQSANGLWPTAIAHRRFHGVVESRGRAVDQAATGEADALLDDLASGGPSIVATAALLIDELGQAFGIPELGQFTRDGQIRRPYWGGFTRDHLFGWAEQNGISLTDELLLEQ